MDNVAQKKCPACGGPIAFDPAKGKLVCEYCGTELDIDTGGAQTNSSTTPHKLDIGFDFDSLNAQATDPNAEDLPIYNCTQCSAEIIAPAENFALNCPYCGNNIVLTQKASGKLRPDGIVPFKFKASELPAMLTSYYKNKPLLPRKFFSESALSKVTGLYVPFWVFNGTLSGDLEFRGEKIRTYRQGDYRCTDTSTYDLGRSVSMSFKDLPVDASAKVEDALMDSIEPFDMSDVKPFDMSYLAGFTADRFDVAKNDIAQRAEKRMRSTADSIARARCGAGYNNISSWGGKFKADLKARYLLLPAYLFTIKYEGVNYSFAVNGQTGKVVGSLPSDKSLKRGIFIKRLILGLFAVLGIAFVMYMTGR